jgi:N-6 DNA Methylase
VALRTKVVMAVDGVDRRETGYYSTPAFVAEFLARTLLSYRPDARCVLDPCVGKGELAGPFARAGLRVIGIDIADRNPQNCSEIVFADFLELAANTRVAGLFSGPGVPPSDIIVANPPYNCHETEYIRSNKPKLIESFGKSTALNMYSLFIRAIIDAAQDGCLIGLVVHDSFLTAVGHKDLRNYLLSECVIKNLHLCPTSLFLSQGADVRTCLLIIEKRRPRAESVVRVSNRVGSVAEFQDMLLEEKFESAKTSTITLTSKLDNREIVIGLPPTLATLFSGPRLGQIAPCITGVSTGNDSKYISPIKRTGFSVPFYKNPASRRFYARPDGFVIDDFDQEARLVPNFMVRNRDLLLRGGISCSSMGVAFGATVRPPDTLCGVNPNIIIDEADKWWLLAYLNSRLCLYLLRGVLIRSNMVTAGYASRIPVPNFDRRTKLVLAELAKGAYKNALGGERTDVEKATIDSVVESILALEEPVVDRLRIFSSNPTRLT